MTRRDFQAIAILSLLFAAWLPSISCASSAEIVYEKAQNSIFTIYSIDEEDEEKSALGSGVAVTEDLIATNCHVALAGRFLFIEVNQKDLLGRLIYYNQKNDLCLIEIAGGSLKASNIRPSHSVKIGEDVFAIGNPEGIKKTISKGIISNKIQDGETEILLTDASISHGSSGGGLFDINGNLIGITVGFHKTGENIGVVLPTELILKILDLSPTSASNSKAAEISNTEVKKASLDNTLTVIGYYGNDKIALMEWNNRCLIGITGRSKDKPTSLAVWFPFAPKVLLIFSRDASIENVTKYFLAIKNDKNIEYQESKSFLYFDKILYSLPIMAINNVKQPAYSLVLNSEITEKLIMLDYFVGQFYRLAGTDGMTSIKFGLDGFTEAFGAYNKYCK